MLILSCCLVFLRLCMCMESIKVYTFARKQHSYFSFFPAV
ncbi:hypothetical protein HMPREF9999_00108 [Alloprevotella sp. oral taxon 473 str. F0040]|nr:hypothetical protein HMPREF9999_00108 [Alloprevotella sp. oral taxon 473 str. F0040]